VYEDIEKAVIDSCKTFASSLDAQERAEITRFLDKGEWGLAFELLCYVLRRDGVQVSAAQYRTISESGRAMKLPDTHWASLQVVDCRDG